jgi:hypothetical protein
MNMTTEPNSWEAQLRQRLIEAEQQDDYPTWDADRVWQNAQQQLAENQAIVPLQLAQKRKRYWYAIAAGLLLWLGSNFISTDFFPVQKQALSEAKPSTHTTPHLNEATLQSTIAQAKKGKKKQFVVAVKPFFSPLNLDKKEIVVENNNTNTQEPTAQKDNEKTQMVQPLPSLSLLQEQKNSDTALTFQPILKGNCTVLNLPLLREEKAIARFFRHFKRFNTEGTLPPNASILVWVQRINGR